MKKFWFMLLGIVLVATEAMAGSIYTGQLGTYTIEVPNGWTILREGGSQDAQMVGPGGEGRGSIGVGITEAKAGSLMDEVMADTANDRVGSPTPITVSGQPCLTVKTQGRGVGNSVFCRFIIPFKDGDMTVTFFMLSVAHPDEASAQADLFFKAVSTVKFAEGLKF
ncbi:MAG: hypothetical protein M1392_01550 [Gammaproteobacteria bacterium]|nr:hypothetical protein [Gammaproteobacteria bacterium]